MNTLRLTLRQLQIFRVVAESGSTAAAAATIALSQSATSAAINELERVLELQLFDRIGQAPATQRQRPHAVCRRPSPSSTAPVDRALGTRPRVAYRHTAHRRQHNHR